MTEQDVLQLPRKKIKSIIANPVKTAEAVDLVYVSDTEPGITRKKKGDGFVFMYGEKPVKDEDTLARIKKLVIPPAWENVWVCTRENGHLQATGIDVLKRKQYRYHSLWNLLRNQTKFYRMYEFGKVLPNIRLHLEKDLALPGLPQRKVLAAIVSLMERTNIRVGNNMYEKLYGSFGLTTLKDKHVDIKGANLNFSFKGKKGVYHNIDIKSKRLAKIVKDCQDIPGKELFQYISEDGSRHCVDSGMVNNYIHEISGGDFTAKDFRTWAGTVHALMAIKELDFTEEVTAIQSKKNVVEVLDKVAKHLGNTRTVCKKYYVHPLIIELYENRSISKYFKQLEKMEINDNKASLTPEEQVIMKILECK
jgi:DNA topoisomerase I